MSHAVAIPEGASDHQREVAERYAAGATVTFEDYQVAVHDTQDCLRAAGWRIDDAEVVDDGGVQQITYVSVAPKALVEEQGEDAMDAIYDSCRGINSALVEDLYFSTAVSAENIEAQRARVEEAKADYGPLVEECLAELGVQRPSSAEDDWWFRAAMEAAESPTTDCIAITGYDDATSLTD